MTISLQQQALLENGVWDKEALKALHNIRVTHPHLLDLTVYGRYDTSKKGTLNVGKSLCDGNLIHLNGEPGRLFDLRKSERPLVIIGMSIS